MVLVDLFRECRRDNQLLEIHAELSFAAKQVIGACLSRGRVEAATNRARRRDLTSIVIGIHAAIAIDANADRHVPAQHFVVADFRDEEQVATAVHRAIYAGQTAAARYVAPRAEQVDADVKAAAGPDHAGRVIGAAE